MIAAGHEDVPPKGWLTLVQLSKQTGARRKTLESALLWGQYRDCPRKVYRVKANDGRLRNVMHFDTTWKPK